MFLVSLFWFFIKSSLFLIVLTFVTGVIRLFVFGIFKRYENPLRDASILKKGDVLLVGKQSVKHSWYIQVSNVLTRKLKHRFWTHAALYQGNGKVWEARPEGILEKEVSVYLSGDYIVRAFRHRYADNPDVMDRVVAFCASKKDSGYGTLGTIFYTISTFMPISFNWLFDNAFIDRLLHLDNAYYCSELIVDAFDEVNYPVSPYDGWRVKPADFISNPLLNDVSSHVESKAEKETAHV